MLNAQSIVKQVFEMKKNVVTIRAGQLATEQGMAAGKPVADFRKPRGTATTGAAAAVKACQIAGSVANERHGLAGKSGEHDFSRFSVRTLPAGSRIDNFNQQIGFTNMTTLMGLALDSATKAGFGGAIMQKCSAAAGVFDPLPKSRSSIVGAEQHSADFRKIDSFSQSQKIMRKPGNAIDSK